MQFNDGLCRVYLAKDSEVRRFKGENIPGFCEIAKAVHRKSGRWSNTDYKLRLDSGVRPVILVYPNRGTWGDDLASWEDVAERLALPLEVVQTIVRDEFPVTARRLDQENPA